MPSRRVAFHVAALTATTLVVTALAVAAPAVASGPPATPAIHPVDPVQHSIPLTGVDLGGVAQPQALTAPPATTAKGPAALTPAIAVRSGISVVGATWPDGAMPAAARLLIRTAKNGAWSPWQALDSDEGHDPDPGSAEAAHERGGTQPYVVTDASAVQVRLDTPTGIAPRGASVDVIDPGTSSADAQVGTATPGAAQAAATQPTIYSRADWGADEKLRKGTVEYGSIQAAFVHHTVSQNNYTAAQVPAIIRGIYAFHVNGRGWNDIGYNFLVDRFGRIWEGRYGGIALPVIGAHTKGYNSESFAMSAIGDYDTAHVPSAIVKAYERLFAWKLGLHGIPATGTVVLNGKRINRISGHRDVESTICPGRYLYADLPAIRAGTAARMGTLARPAIARNLDGDVGGTPDLLARSSPTSAAAIVATDTRVPVAGSQVLGPSGWGQLGLVTVSADLTGDGKADVVARDNATGQLKIYAGDGAGHLSAATPRGSGWAGIRRLLAPGDVDGDGHADLLGVTTAGQLILYSGDGHGWVASQRVVGSSGWAAFTELTAVRNFAGDGHVDLLAVRSDGVQLLYPGLGTGGFGTRRQIGSGWQVTDTLVGMGDLDGDGGVAVVTREAGTGVMRTYFGTGTGAYGSRLFWGTGWQQLSNLSGGVDVNGDGHTDLVAVRSGQLLLYPGTGQHEYSAVAATPIDLTGMDDAFVLGDLNHDGAAEVIARQPSTGALMLYDDAGRPGASPMPRHVGSGWNVMNLIEPAGDLTMDGVPDVLARSAATGDLYLYPMTSTGGFTSRVLLATGMGAMADIVGVGPNDPGVAPDIVAFQGGGGKLLIYPGNGPGRLLTPIVVRSSTSGVTHLVAAGDVDGDGRSDLLFEHPDGSLAVLAGLSSGGYAASRLLAENQKVVGRELG